MFPLYEFFLLNRKGDLERHFSARPRKQTLEALTNPHHYMASLERDDGALHVHKGMPDISIVYHLMEERGKDINLYDWFQSFVMVVDNDVKLTTSSKDGKKKKKKRGKNNKSESTDALEELSSNLQNSMNNLDLQARFVAVVSDLHQLTNRNSISYRLFLDLLAGVA